MKQLLYTSCVAGKSLSGSSGFQIRAVTEGLRSEQLRAAVAYVGYQLPPTIRPTDTTAAEAPVRLAWLDTADAGRVLAHSVYVGKDPMTGRYGNFFSHALLDVPAAYHAGHAIRSWGSSEWKTQDDDGGTVLADLEHIFQGAALNDSDLTKFLSRDRHRTLLAFVLNAVFLPNNKQRVFVVAPPLAVALCIYGVTRIVPAGYLNRLTFSTYEYAPLTCNAHIVGTWFGDGSSVDLPSSCYSGSGFGYNVYSGKHTTLASNGEYVDYAVKAAASGEWHVIDKRRAFADQCHLDEPSMLSTLYTVYRTGTVVGLSKEDCRSMLANQRLALYMAERARGFLQRLIELGRTDAEFFLKLLPSLPELRQAYEKSPQPPSDLPDEVEVDLSAWLSIARYLSHPSVAEQAVVSLVLAIQRVPANAQDSIKEQLITALATAMVIEGMSPTCQTNIETALLAVGSFISSGPRELYGKLLCKCDADAARLVSRPDLLRALVRIGLGVRLPSRLAERMGKPHVREVRELLRSVSRQGGERAVSEVARSFKRTRGRDRRLWHRAADTATRRFVRLTIRLLLVTCIVAAIALCVAAIAFGWAQISEWTTTAVNWFRGVVDSGEMNE